jgi:uncharacterized membrane protein YdbT with pleckstrin-like domain
MASYVEGALIPGESVSYVGNISLWGLSHLILLGFILLPVFGIGLFFWLAAFIRYKTTELAVTNKRVIAKFGFISRHTMEMNINKVESIQVTQSIFGRLLDFGTLIIAGTGSQQAPIAGISNPMGFRKAFMSAQDNADSGRGQTRG